MYKWSDHLKLSITYFEDFIYFIITIEVHGASFSPKFGLKNFIKYLGDLYHQQMEKQNCRHEGKWESDLGSYPKVKFLDFSSV